MEILQPSKITHDFYKNSNKKHIKKQANNNKPH